MAARPVAPSPTTTVSAQTSPRRGGRPREEPSDQTGRFGEAKGGGRVVGIGYYGRVLICHDGAEVPSCGERMVSGKPFRAPSTEAALAAGKRRSIWSTRGRAVARRLCESYAACVPAPEAASLASLG